MQINIITLWCTVYAQSVTLYCVSDADSDCEAEQKLESTILTQTLEVFEQKSSEVVQRTGFMGPKKGILYYRHYYCCLYCTRENITPFFGKGTRGDTYTARQQYRVEAEVNCKCCFDI